MDSEDPIPELKRQLARSIVERVQGWNQIYGQYYGRGERGLRAQGSLYASAIHLLVAPPTSPKTSASVLPEDLRTWNE